MYTFASDNPTTLYKNILEELNEHGERLSPRGKLIAELRPVSIEYLDPYKQVTFLAKRRINPFFQMAEALWILSGHADVEWLCKFNKNMSSFSDDGKFFNGSYGERIRRWGDNDAHGVKAIGRDGEGALDQLKDCYMRILEDKDTRQGLIAIGNPTFDNYQYINNEHGLDICCNIYITFKVRDDKLNMCVFNRSNDLNWGTFGANLAQFTFIMETMHSLLKNSGVKEFENLSMGTYHQITDSLHIYLDNYGSKINSEVLDYYKEHEYTPVDFTCYQEPTMNSNFAKFQYSLDTYWNEFDSIITNDKITHSEVMDVMNKIDSMVSGGTFDSKIAFMVKSMLCYRLVRLKRLEEAMEIMYHLPSCQWKISMMYFLKNFINKIEDEDKKAVIKGHYSGNVRNLVVDLIDKNEEKTLREYLSF